jgi:hypothetical protein
MKYINQYRFNRKVNKMVKAIEEVKQSIICDDCDEECSEDCPIKMVCSEMSRVQMWGMYKIKKTTVE